MSKARNLSQVIVDAGGDINASSLDNVTPASISDKTNTSTGAFDIPTGTTAERPGTPASGMTRFNSSANFMEIYNGSAWVAVGDQSAIYSVEYLVVAGGGEELVHRSAHVALKQTLTHLAAEAAQIA